VIKVEGEMLVDVELDKVGKLGQEYIVRLKNIENAKKAIVEIRKEILSELRKQKRQSIALDYSPYKRVCLKVKIIESREVLVMEKLKG